jgi:outer membrane usher protein
VIRRDQEADGSEQHFTLPYASVPVLQREGRLKYALSGGQYRSYNSSVEKTLSGKSPRSMVCSMASLYGGVQGSSKYQSLAVGAGKNMGDFGALSADITQGWSSPAHTAKTHGQSWRALQQERTQYRHQFSIAGYRYSTRGYYGMQDVLDSYGDSSALQDRRRHRVELTMSQTLGDERGH